MLFLPGRNYDGDVLRSEYVRWMRGFEGVRYVWGGENYLGIDCSGLVRKPLILANLSYGFRTLNGRLVRHAFELWWHDASAVALRDRYRDWTMELSRAENINSADHSALRPGDLAVTSDGVHVLAYVGTNIWMEADPNVGRVIQVEVTSENPWFKEPVVLMRWRMAGSQ